MDLSSEALLALADWRRRVAELYARIRNDPDLERAWRGWCETRHELFVSHPQSPIPPSSRPAYDGPPVHPYDPAARTTAEVRPATPETVEIANSDGVNTRFVRFGEAWFELYGRKAHLELYWLEAYGGGIYLSFRDADLGRHDIRGGPVPPRHRERRRSGVGRSDSCWTSTSPTTRHAPTTRSGPARCRLRRTGCRSRSRPGSGTAPSRSRDTARRSPGSRGGRSRAR